VTVIVSDTNLSDTKTNVPLEHGGDLGAARNLFPGAPEPFVDLSTGINPFAYPLPQLPSDIFAGLPEQAALDQLAACAAKAYGAPSASHVAAAPGTQSLLAPVFALARIGRAAVLSPTYAEHARVAALVGHSVRNIEDVGRLKDAGLAVVVNPNNPDGRLLPSPTLLALAEELRASGGLLVVDEAFMDVGPQRATLASEVGCGNLVVLRSFGKFFGLAGLRLGFALAAPDIIERLKALLGPWPVSGPAIAVGARALTDQVWVDATRVRLATAAMRLDALLHEARLQVIGGTSLFRAVRMSDAAALFLRLGQAGIVVRRFSEWPDLLRVGLPADEPSWERLRAVLVP